jgi:hypothetical protein
MASTQPVPQTKAAATAYQPTPPEQAVLATHLARKKARPPAPRMRESRDDDGVGVIGFDHPKPAVAQVLLMEALGTLDPDFLDGLLLQLDAVSIPGRRSEGLGLNFMLAMVRGVKPRDEIEAMLAAQMAAIHVAAMTFGRRVKPSAVPRMDAAAASFAKLARTFAAHVDTLKRYRGGAEQKVTVENVTVNDGGQAIVGQVEMKGVEMNGVAMAGVEMGPRENPRTTPCTGAATEEPAEAIAGVRTEIPRTTPCTEAVTEEPAEAIAGVSTEIPRTTPCTEAVTEQPAEPMARASTETPRTTPCTGAAASARRETDPGSSPEIPWTTSCTGAVNGRRRPGAYMRGFAQNPGTTP